MSHSLRADVAIDWFAVRTKVAGELQKLLADRIPLAVRDVRQLMHAKNGPVCGVAKWLRLAELRPRRMRTKSPVAGSRMRTWLTMSPRQRSSFAEEAATEVFDRFGVRTPTIDESCYEGSRSCIRLVETRAVCWSLLDGTAVLGARGGKLSGSNVFEVMFWETRSPFSPRWQSAIFSGHCPLMHTSPFVRLSRSR